MLNPDTIKSWAEATSETIAAIKTAIGFLPSGKARKDTERLLVKAETEQKNAEAALAMKFGFELCEYCWPPEIVLISPTTQHLECRHCGRPPLRVERQENLQKIWRSKQLNYNV